MLSIVIPALNAREPLERLLCTLESFADGEIIFVDAGSTDGTREVVEALGAQLVSAPKGRGTQLAAGAEAVGGDWLLFIHADSQMGCNWLCAVDNFMQDPKNLARAGYFRLRFDDPSPQARRVERMAAWRSRVFGLPYGDQGLLIHRSLYDDVGGYRPIPLMEDVDLVRRIGRKRLVALDADIVTSADRYRRDGWWLRPIRNLFCLALYFCRIPPHLIAKVYG